jgi:hypothetical protein
MQRLEQIAQAHSVRRLGLHQPADEPDAAAKLTLPLVNNQAL